MRSTSTPHSAAQASPRQKRDNADMQSASEREQCHVSDGAFEKGETNGLMKIVVDANSREILGAAVLGTGGDEVIHCVLDTMYAKAPYAVLQRAMHIHPTVSEYVPFLLEN